MTGVVLRRAAGKAGPIQKRERGTGKTHAVDGLLLKSIEELLSQRPSLSTKASRTIGTHSYTSCALYCFAALRFYFSHPTSTAITLKSSGKLVPARFSVADLNHPGASAKSGI